MEVEGMYDGVVFTREVCAALKGLDGNYFATVVEALWEYGLDGEVDGCRQQFFEEDPVCRAVYLLARDHVSGINSGGDHNER